VTLNSCTAVLPVGLTFFFIHLTCTYPALLLNCVLPATDFMPHCHDSIYMPAMYTEISILEEKRGWVRNPTQTCCIACGKTDASVLSLLFWMGGRQISMPAASPSVCHTLSPAFPSALLSSWATGTLGAEDRYVLKTRFCSPILLLLLTTCDNTSTIQHCASILLSSFLLTLLYTTVAFLILYYMYLYLW
jgi:hypothetical protein